eukprot:8336702-Alexandrium_andersonii.AAC.1
MRGGAPQRPEPCPRSATVRAHSWGSSQAGATQSLLRTDCWSATIRPEPATRLIPAASRGSGARARAAARRGSGTRRGGTACNPGARNRR